MSTTKRTSLTFKIKPIFVKHIFVTHNSPIKTSISHCSNLNYILVLWRFPPLARGGHAFRRFASERFSLLSQAERLLTSFSLCSKLAGWPPSARLQSLTQKNFVIFPTFFFSSCINFTFFSYCIYEQKIFSLQPRRNLCSELLHFQHYRNDTYGKTSSAAMTDLSLSFSSSG